MSFPEGEVILVSAYLDIKFPATFDSWFQQLQTENSRNHKKRWAS